MSIRMQDLGEVAYGGAVTLTEWWDDRRIEEGKIAKKDIWKKASFYTYLGIGLPATLISAMGWWRQMGLWAEHVSHGFLYDMPRFIYNVVKAMGEETPAASRSRANSDAIRQAQEILNRRQRGAAPAAPAAPAARQLPTGASARVLTPMGEEVIASVT
jgi:hypothetical protein